MDKKLFWILRLVLFGAGAAVFLAGACLALLKGEYASSPALFWVMVLCHLGCRAGLVWLLRKKQ